MARRGQRGYPRSRTATSHPTYLGLAACFARRPSLGDHLKVRLLTQKRGHGASEFGVVLH
jgi:hypothetical protein